MSAKYGENIRARREELGISQTDLAEAIGIKKQLLWKYESGTVKNIPLPRVEAIAKALHCTTAYITGWGEKETPTVVSGGQEENEETIILSNLSEIQRELIKDVIKLSDQKASAVLPIVEALLSGQQVPGDL